MIFCYKDFSIDLSSLTRLYPAALVEVPHDKPAQVSIEWALMKQEKVKIIGYLLVFDTDPIGEIPKNRKEIVFKTKEELDSVIMEVAALLK